MDEDASNFDDTPAGEQPEAELASIDEDMHDGDAVEPSDAFAVSPDDAADDNGMPERADVEAASEVPPGNGAAVATAPQPVEQMQWFVLKVQSNREKSIRSSLIRRIKREGLEDFFGDVIIPTEKVVEKSKGGKKRVTERKLYPGYIMIHMVLNDETWYLVRDTGGVGDFTGAAGKPIPMQEEEIKRMLGLEETKEAEPAKIKIDLAPGDIVKIKEGSFESFEGAIDAIDEEHGKITVLVEIFGRSVPTELEYWQVEKI
ncbi:MAG: transcription termination/antitermination protein NusG [Planctomycetaceae bacterium]